MTKPYMRSDLWECFLELYAHKMIFALPVHGSSTWVTKDHKVIIMLILSID